MRNRLIYIVLVVLVMASIINIASADTDVNVTEYIEKWTGHVPSLEPLNENEMRYLSFGDSQEIGINYEIHRQNNIILLIVALMYALTAGLVMFAYLRVYCK